MKEPIRILGLTPRCPCHIIIPLYFRVSIWHRGRVVHEAILERKTGINF